MKFLKFYFVLNFTFLLFHFSFSQDVTIDTIQANKYLKIANKLSSEAKQDSAIIYADKAQVLYTKHFGKYCLQNNVCLILKGRACYIDIEYEKALKYYYQSLEINKLHFGENSLNTATSFFSLGATSLNNSEYDNAEDYLNKCISIRLALLGENSTDIAVSNYALGILYWNKSNYEKSLECYFKTVDIYKNLNLQDSYDGQRIYTNIGSVYSSMSEYNKALEYFYKGRDLFIAHYGDKSIDLALIYNGLGEVFYNQANYDKALDYQMKSLDIFLYFGCKTGYTPDTYRNIGLTYTKKSDYHNALENLNKSLEMSIELVGENSTRVASCCNNIGEVYGYKNEYDKAFDYLFRSLNISKKLYGDKNTEIADCCKNIATIYSKTGNYSNALKYYQYGISSCIVNFNDTLNVFSVPKISNYLEWKIVLQLLKQKAELLADCTKNLSENDEFATESNRNMLALKHFQACDTLIMQARTQISQEKDKLTISEISESIYNETIEICLKLNRPELAYLYSEKQKTGLLLSKLAEKNAKLNAGIPEKLTAQEMLLSKKITEYKITLNNENDSLLNTQTEELLFNANREYELLISQLKANYPRYSELSGHIYIPEIPEIQTIIDEATAIRSYTISDSAIYIFTITKSEFSVDTVSKSKNFNQNLTDYANALQNTDKQNNGSLLKNSEILYKQLFPKKADFNKNIKKITVIPDDSLSQIPFETLICEKFSGDVNNISEFPFLIKKFEVSYSPSISLFFKLKTTKTQVPKQDIAIIAPVFSGKDTLLSCKSDSLSDSYEYYRNFTILDKSSEKMIIKPLPYTESEAKSIFKIYGKRNSELCMYNSADENYVKTGNLQNFKIIHFATHAVSNSENPEFAGIVLAQDTINGEDGFLHSNEIYALKLNAGLVTLSACQTASGELVKGEGVMDLSRAFFYAGAKNVISTLWNVEDQSTAELMTIFYKKLEKETNISESLQNAKLEMLNSKNQKFRHPKYWSPFLLIGNAE